MQNTSKNWYVFGYDTSVFQPRVARIPNLCYLEYSWVWGDEHDEHPEIINTIGNQTWLAGNHLFVFDFPSCKSPCVMSFPIVSPYMSMTFPIFLFNMCQVFALYDLHFQWSVPIFLKHYSIKTSGYRYVYWTMNHSQMGGLFSSALQIVGTYLCFQCLTD